MRASQSCGLSLIALIAMCGLTPAHGSAQETMEYRVREGDTCGSIARRVYGNSQRYDLIHRANPALGPMPHNLEPGTVLTLPRVEGAGGADATVTAVRRQVASQAPRAPRWDRARVGQELGQGWRVNTEERSTAELTFRSSSVVSIRERTLVIVYGASVREEREESARAVVREGSMLSRLSALSGGEALEVETASSRATLRSGEASVDVEEDGTTRVAVHTGDAATVRGANGRNAVAVPAGMGTKVRRNRPPSRPRPLPRAPSWLEGAPQRFIAIGTHGGTLRAAWEPVPDASRYRVEVARRADGRDLVFATEVDAEVREIEMRRVPPGTYHLRVATIDSDRFEGRPGSSVELTMLEAAVTGPGAEENAPSPPDTLTASLEDLDSGLADLDFENLPDRPAEVLQHSRLALPGEVRCTVSEQPLEASLVLGALGEQTLRCEDGGAPIADATLRVTSASLQLYADASDVAPSIVRGEEEHVRVVLEGADPGGLTLAGGPGVNVMAVTPHPRGGLRALLRLAADAPEVALVRVVTADERELASASVHTIAVEIAPEPEPEPRPHALSEALGLSAFASWVGLRDERRRGSGMHLAVTGQSAADGDPDALLRLSAGLRASMFEERLRLDVAVPLDIVGSQTRSAQRGSRDVYAAASSLIVDDRELGLGLAAEAGVWVPTAGGQGLDRARLMLAVDASLRFMDERLAVRTRQAGLFDLVGLDDDGSLLWASAYGFDVWIAGPLSAGIELSLVMGREDAQDWIAAGVGGGLALDFHPIVISLAGRYGFGDDAILGRGLISAAVRGVYDL